MRPACRELFFNPWKSCEIPNHHWGNMRGALVTVFLYYMKDRTNKSQADPHRALNRKALKSTAVAPVTMEHKIYKTNVPVI